MANVINPHYVYLGGKIKQMYLSYAYCFVCGGYLPSRKRVFCPQCKEHLNCDNIPYNKSVKSKLNGDRMTN